MKLLREEILPGVFLTAIREDRFKTGVMTAIALTPLKRETASMNALLPQVLSRGTASLPDMTAIQAKLDELYGASVEPTVFKLGEIQCIGFLSTFCDGRFLPEKQDITAECASLLGELWLKPNTRGGLLRPEYVESERDKLCERIEAQLNDKRSYANRRLIENMCCYEDFGVGSLGTVGDAESIYYVQLSRHYRDLLATSPFELFYCGSSEPEDVRDRLAEAFMTLPRGELCEELGTDIRMNAVTAEPRIFTEELDVAQGQLVLGFRLGECMEDPDPAVLLTLSTLFGGGANSLLFRNVREKESLCYYAYSTLDLHKGLLIAQAGIPFDKYDAARREMLAQLDAIREGRFTDEDLAAAKHFRAGVLRENADDPVQLFLHWFGQTLLGSMYAPDELAGLIGNVTRGEVIAAAQSVVLDSEYFLKGEANG